MLLFALWPAGDYTLAVPDQIYNSLFVECFIFMTRFSSASLEVSNDHRTDWKPQNLTGICLKNSHRQVLLSVHDNKVTHTQLTLCMHHNTPIWVCFQQSPVVSPGVKSDAWWWGHRLSTEFSLRRTWTALHSRHPFFFSFYYWSPKNNLSSKIKSDHGS